MADEIIEPKKRQQLVWVKDKAGNEYMCPIDALKDPKNASENELKNCVDDATIPVSGPGG